MKIIKVIVDELPKSCAECDEQTMNRCRFTGTFVFGLFTRADDCPLALERDNKKIANEVM